MDLRQMLMFTTLADELHFGRAASRIGISQPALSQQMQRLEGDLGAQLFTRTSRAVRLTTVGEMFLESCRRTLAEADRARMTVEDALSGVMGRLVIGCLGAAANGPLPALVQAFLGENPRRVVEVRHFLDSGAQERALIAESIDIGFVRSISMQDEISGVRLYDDPFVVCVSEGHPLASRDQIALRQLRDEAMVFWPRSLNPSYYDLIIEGCRSQGFEPAISGYATSLETQLALVAAGVGVSLQAASNTSMHRSGVVAVKLDPTDIESPVWLIFRRWHRSHLADRFIAAAKSMLENR